MEDKPNMKIRFSADSTCDMNAEFLARYPVESIPLTVDLEGKSHRDGVDITPDEIISRVNGGAPLPKTAAVNSEDYRAVFTRLLEDCDAVIHFNISSDFSCCHQNATLAAEGLPVYCMDSRNLSSGTALLVAEAYDRANAGMPAEQIAEEVRAMVDKIDTSFILDRLDYLYKGGRCSMLSLLGANVLHIRPCIEVVNGKMVVGKKYRGTYERCLRQYLADRLRAKDEIVPQRVFITHTGVSNVAIDSILDIVRSAIPFAEVYETRAGCSITCHCGENCCGILMVRK